MVVEELVFFVVVPMCALLTLEAVRNLAVGPGHVCAAGRDGLMPPIYPTLAVVAAVAVVVLELLVLRSGLFRQRAYWIAMAIVFVFMIPVDGWLTKLSAPIVVYRDGDTSGIRPVWDIPLEEFAYAFALLTLVILVWDRAGSVRRGDDPRSRVLVVGSFVAMEAVSLRQCTAG